MRLPYPGLRAFTRDESDLFFGRDGCTDAMVDRLASTRFLAVLGASGSGKSSLVRTGLLEALALGLHSTAGSGWQVADLHPAGEPLRNLAAALLASSSAPLDAASVDLLADFLRRGPRSLIEWAAGGNLAPGTNLLILVDQFEELFRYGSYASQEEAEAFVALLIETAASNDTRLHVVMTMRSEYLGACALIPGLADRINAGLYLTPRMTREECREAIEGPAAVAGFSVERALVTRLLNDLATFAPWGGAEGIDQADRLAKRADQLPVMQHVLNLLWMRAAGSAGPLVLTLTDYETLGGLAGALDAHGAAILGSLSERRQRSARIVFEALVSGSSVADAIRRPSRIGELVELTGSRDDVEAIVGAFSAADCNFLRVGEAAPETGDRFVDISHESLIRQWTPLRHWMMGEARNAAGWRRLLSAEERYREREGSLLTGLDLSSLSAWWESAAPTPAWARRHGGRFAEARSFLEASREADTKEADARRRHEKRERRQLQVGIGVLGVALAAALIFSVLAQQRQQALEASRSQLERNNSDLEQASIAARSATSMAESQRDAANRARTDAEEMTRQAQASELRARRSEEEAKRGREQNQAAIQAIEAGKYAEALPILRGTQASSRATATPLTTVTDQNQAAATRRAIESLLGDAAGPAATATASDAPDVSGLVERLLGNDGGQAKVLEARRRFDQTPTADSLEAFRVAVEAFGKSDQRPSAGGAIHVELLEAAEALLGRNASEENRRAAWLTVVTAGDALKSSDQDRANAAFTRSVALAETLPDNQSDRYRRVVSYERMGDARESAGDNAGAASWFVKELDVARRRHAAEPSPETLSSLRFAVTRAARATQKAGRPADAIPWRAELLLATDALVQRQPSSEVLREAWNSYVDVGDARAGSERAAARAAFDRSLALAEQLPYTSEDLVRRLVSYDRVGESEFTDKRFEGARVQFSKEADLARAVFALGVSDANFVRLQVAIGQQTRVERELKNDAAIHKLQAEVANAAEKTLATIEGSGPDDQFSRGSILEALADARLGEGKPAEARSAFGRSAEAMERYLRNFRAVSTPRIAAADDLDLFVRWGNLSWAWMRAGNAAKAIEAADRGLALESDVAWIEGNKAHGLLFSGKDREATELYVRIRKRTTGDRTLLDITREDFATLNQLGIEHLAMPAILLQMEKD